MSEQTRCIHGVEMDADGAHFDGCAKCAGADFGASDTPTPPQAEKPSERRGACMCCGSTACQFEAIAALGSDRDAWKARAEKAEAWGRQAKELLESRDRMLDRRLELLAAAQAREAKLREAKDRAESLLALCWDNECIADLHDGNCSLGGTQLTHCTCELIVELRAVLDSFNAAALSDSPPAAEPKCGPKHGTAEPCDHCRQHGHTTPCIACACGEKAPPQFSECSQCANGPCGPVCVAPPAEVCGAELRAPLGGEIVRCSLPPHDGKKTFHRAPNKNGTVYYSDYQIAALSDSPPTPAAPATDSGTTIECSNCEQEDDSEGVAWMCERCWQIPWALLRELVAAIDPALADRLDDDTSDDRETVKQAIAKIASPPCPICAAAAEEDGVRRLAVRASEMCIDLTREVAELKRQLADADRVGRSYGTAAVEEIDALKDRLDQIAKLAQPGIYIYGEGFEGDAPQKRDRLRDLHEVISGRLGDAQEALRDVERDLERARRVGSAVPAPAMHLPAQSAELQAELNSISYALTNLDGALKDLMFDHGLRNRTLDPIRNALVRARRLCPVQHDDQQGGQPVEHDPADMTCFHGCRGDAKPFRGGFHWCDGCNTCRAKTINANRASKGLPPLSADDLNRMQLAGLLEFDADDPSGAKKALQPEGE